MISTFDDYVLPQAIKRAQEKFKNATPSQFFSAARQNDIDAINLLFYNGRSVIARAFYKYFLGPDRKYWRARILDGDDQEFAAEVYTMLQGRGLAANPLDKFKEGSYKNPSLAFVMNKFNYYLLRYAQNLAWVMNRERGMKGMTGYTKKGVMPTFVSQDVTDEEGKSATSEIGDVDTSYERTEQSEEVKQFLNFINKNYPDLSEVAKLGAEGYNFKDIGKKLGISDYYVQKIQKQLKDIYMKNFEESVMREKADKNTDAGNYKPEIRYEPEVKKHSDLFDLNVGDTIFLDPKTFHSYDPDQKDGQYAVVTRVRDDDTILVAASNGENFEILSPDHIAKIKESGKFVDIPRPANDSDNYYNPNPGLAEQIYDTEFAIQMAKNMGLGARVKQLQAKLEALKIAKEKADKEKAAKKKVKKVKEAWRDSVPSKKDHLFILCKGDKDIWSIYEKKGDGTYSVLYSLPSRIDFSEDDLRSIAEEFKSAVSGSQVKFSDKSVAKDFIKEVKSALKGVKELAEEEPEEEEESEELEESIDNDAYKNRYNSARDKAKALKNTHSRADIRKILIKNYRIKAEDANGIISALYESLNLDGSAGSEYDFDSFSSDQQEYLLKATDLHNKGYTLDDIKDKLGYGVVSDEVLEDAFGEDLGLEEKEDSDYDEDYYFSESDISIGTKVRIRPEFSESINGDIGIVKSFSPKGNFILVETREGILPFHFSDLKEAYNPKEIMTPEEESSTEEDEYKPESHAAQSSTAKDQIKEDTEKVDGGYKVKEEYEDPELGDPFLDTSDTNYEDGTSAEDTGANLEEGFGPMAGPQVGSMRTDKPTDNIPWPEELSSENDMRDEDNEDRWDFMNGDEE